MDQGPRTKDHRALALVTVISLLALLLILVTSLLSLSGAEMHQARTSSQSSHASQLADLATSITLAQLRTATAGETGEPAGFWAAQPGMVRRYADDGTFRAGYKLYSSSSMIHAGPETDLIQERPDASWDANPHRFVDLNEPAVRPAPGGGTRTHFPIVDPRSATSLGVAPPIDGFSYSDTAAGSPLAGVITPGEAAPDALRLPMPVEWLYLLQDGTAGTLDETGRFQGPHPATAANPIVGRVAFWADDESAKINVNTASEPTYFATPTLNNGTYQSTRTFDWAWARSQPAAGEFQRYPGHPATTAISPVLLPGRNVTPPDKATLYTIMPKLEHGGTEAGTRNIVQPPTPYNTSRALAERLFSSRDDFLFHMDRRPNPLSFTSGLAPHQVVERSRFFLTPWGRSPELTLNGTPRIAIWPVGHRPEQRTIFDNLIAFCSSFGRPGTADHRFYFAREIADSASHDINLPRNRQLISYLEHLASTSMPGYPASFAQKYPQDHRQILIQIFDYIRSTNLYDARLEDNHTLTGANASYPRILANLPATTRTFTEGRFNGGSGYHGAGFGFYPGNGQVVPARDGSNQGFGRYYTLDEAAMLFIACADGTPNSDNPYLADPSIPDPWKGGFAVNFSDSSGSTRYFSNFPPEPPAGIYGANPGHPGYQRVNWNYALENRTPLPRNTTRVQSTLLLEFFTVAAGYQILRGDFGARVRNLSRLSLNGQPLFHPSRDTVTIKSHWDIADVVHGGYRGGGDPDPRGVLSGRRAPAIGNQPADDGYGNTGLPAPDNDRWNYDLLSEYIDVPQDAPMRFQASGPIEIEILDNRAGPSAPPVQTIVLRFPDESLIPPPLMALNYANGTANAMPACMFWSFHRDGFNGREDSSNPIKTSGRIRGREAMHHPWNFLYHHGRDVICSLVPWHGDYRLIAASPRVETDPGSPWIMGGQRWTFMPHPGYPTTASRGQHNMNHRYNWIPGFLHSPNANLRIFPGAWGGQFAHDFPAIPAAAAASHRYGDFDEAAGNGIGGAQINKPDEGNFYTGGVYDASTALTPYFDHDWMFAGMEDSFFSPNRIMPSPVMMGSLPTGVVSQDPWRTLLFRPQARTSYGTLHPGAAAEHGGQDPPDHAILDWFYMPVVEPYALTEPGSTAGRINLNYQMMPFAHIRRATGLHAVLKDELIPKINSGGTGWQIPLDIDATLAQFDDYFATGKIFSSATKICEIHMIPRVDTASGDPAAFQNTSSTARARMDAFWDAFRGTGDNMRERPYVHIYPRVTTRSQTWTVHVRAQSITKARSSDPAIFDPDRDKVAAEYRGATTVERYLDAADPDLPDHATNPTAPSLDHFHRYRILSQQRFQP